MAMNYVWWVDFTTAWRDIGWHYAHPVHFTEFWYTLGRGQ